MPSISFATELPPQSHVLDSLLHRICMVHIGCVRYLCATVTKCLMSTAPRRKEFFCFRVAELLVHRFGSVDYGLGENLNWTSWQQEVVFHFLANGNQTERNDLGQVIVSKAFSE